ncbi:hypothetical protein [Planctomicrobium piriforme]|uniref:DUF3352 domain-containing protein n=1 Tax=Planctomicrobium piriforme TaxID=1576369 RepID=A0A1I3JTL2_9PLAN|nr:hypothetical protein [Planctomicrobium piriforme]SFI63592.1 hypothetical protein SAMN05421753_1119 [Planctomicrobium piriforme]
MLRTTLASLALTLACLAGTVATAQDSPLQYFTQDVDVIIRLREPDQTAEKLIKVADKIQPGIGEGIKAQQTQGLGQLISNPELTGVDQSRDWYVGVYAEGTEEPVVVFAIPAVKAEDMVSALGDDITSEVHQTWVLYTEADAIPQAKESATAITLLGKDAQARLADGDLTVYVNAKHLVDVYSEQIELAQDKVLDALNNLRFMPEQGGVNLESIVGLYGTMAESFFRGVEDAQAVSVNVSLSDAEIAVDKFVEFAPDSKSAEFLTQNQQSDMALLSKLPSNWPMYYAFSGSTSELTRFGIKTSLSMFKEGDEQKQLEEEMTKQLDGITYGPLVSAIDVVESSSGALRGASIFTASPVDKVREFARMSVEKLGTIETEQFVQTSTLQKDAETFGPYKADLTIIKQDYKEDGDPTGIAEKMQHVMFGTEGMQNRMLYLNDQYINTIGGGPQLMKDIVAGLDSKKANSAEKPRSGLMKQANIIALIDLPGFTGRALKAASHVEGFRVPINAQMIDNLGLRTSYMGFAMGSEGNTLKVQTRVPIDQITGLTKLGVLIAGAMQAPL